MVSPRTNLQFAPRIIQYASEGLTYLAGSGPVGRATTQAANWAWPNVVPGISTAMQLYQNGWISYDEYRAWALILGVDSKASGLHGYTYRLENGIVVPGERVSSGADRGNWSTVLWDRAWIPSLTQAISYSNRGLISADFLNHVMQRNGINVAPFQYLVRNDIYQFPSPSDILSFASRYMWGLDTRSRLGLDGDFDLSSEWTKWATATGLGPVRIIGDDGQERTLDMRREYWANHWKLPNIGQAQRMLWRIRDDNATVNETYVPGVRPFTIQDFDAVAAVSGYAPLMRDRLRVLAHKIPERRVLLQLVKKGKVTQSQLSDYTLGLGYRPDVAADLAAALWADRYKQLPLTMLYKLDNHGLLAPGELKTRVEALDYDPADIDKILSLPRKPIPFSLVLKMVTRKIVDKDYFLKRAKQEGFTPEDSELIYNYYRNDLVYGQAKQAVSKIEEAYKLGLIDRPTAYSMLRQQGATANESDLATDYIDFDVKLDHVKKVLQAVKKAYIRGELHPSAAKHELSTMGMSDASIDRYASEWNYDIVSAGRELSASQNVNALKRGLISVDTFAARLSNLGYHADDTNLLQLSAMQDVAKSNAAAAFKAARTVAAQQRAAKQQLAAILREKKNAERDLARHGSPAQLARWSAKGLISRGVALARLKQLEWPLDDATRLLDDALVAAPKKSGASSSTGKQKGTGGSNVPPVPSS